MLGFGSLAKRIFGTSNDRVVRQLQPLVGRINALEKTHEAMSDAELAGRTAVFRERLAAGEKLDALLPEAFATVREAAKRTLGQRHLQCAAQGRHGAAPGQDRGNEDRRRQDAGRHPRRST